MGFSVGITFGASMGLMGLIWGLGLGFSVGIYLDLPVLAAVVGSGAWDWEGSSQGAGAPVRFLCRDMEDTWRGRGSEKGLVVILLMGGNGSY